MQRQGSFSQAEYAGKKKQTRRDKFLAEMEQVVPWARLVERLRPFYPKGERGRPPIGLERMLRLYFLQQWYGLADEALEDALYDSQALRGFAGIDLSVAAVPDATTVLNFRHWLEEHDLTRALFDEVGAMLEERGLLMRQGTIVDATIIAAPPSTKNKSKARDPEMHQTKKGNQWHFGMKAHIGVDVASGVVHTVVGTAANEADINQTAALLHGQEEAVFADAGYTGADKRPELEDRDVSWNIAIKRSIIKALPKALRDLAEPVERALSQVRAWVEHPFHIVKNLFRHKKLRYRGLAKNTAQLHTLFALANLVIVKKTLLAQRRPDHTRTLSLIPKTTQETRPQPRFLPPRPLPTGRAARKSGVGRRTVSYPRNVQCFLSAHTFIFIRINRYCRFCELEPRRLGSQKVQSRLGFAAGNRFPGVTSKRGVAKVRKGHGRACCSLVRAAAVGSASALNQS